MKLVSLKVEREFEYLSDENLDHPIKVARIAKEFIGDSFVEKALVISTDVHLKPIAASIVGQGSAMTTFVPTAEVLRTVLLSGGVRFFFVHNHPTGKARPSAEDLMNSAELANAAKSVGLEMVDSIIIGPEEEAYSIGAGEAFSLRSENEAA